MKGALDAAYKLPLSTVHHRVCHIHCLYCNYRLWKTGDEEQKAGRGGRIVRWAGLGILLYGAGDSSDLSRYPQMQYSGHHPDFYPAGEPAVPVCHEHEAGQDFRSVGNDIHIAESAGINVNRIRIIATIFSTVLASWGSLPSCRTWKAFSTYTAQQNVGTFPSPHCWWRRVH